MSQRIKITYSILLDDLESEIARLMDSTLLKLETISEGGAWLHFRPSGPFLTGKAYSQIEDWRHKLLEVDTELGDINNLISSYLNYENQERSPPPQEDGHTPPPPEAFNIENVQERLSQFKQAIIEGASDPGGGELPNEVSD